MAIFNSYVSLPEGDLWKLSKGAWTFLDSWPGSEVGSLLDVSYPNPSAISYFLINFDTSSSYHHGFTHHFKSRNPPNFLSESGGPQNCDFTRDNDILTFSEPGGLMFFSPAPFFFKPRSARPRRLWIRCCRYPSRPASPKSSCCSSSLGPSRVQPMRDTMVM